MARGLVWGAAAAGALYWASKQPGGIKATLRRLKGTAREIQEGADPVDAGRRFLKGRSSRPVADAEYPSDVPTGMTSMTYER